MNTLELNRNLPFEKLSAEKRFLLVVICSALCGFLIGVSHSTWQVMAESSQVLSGIVKYPTPSPFYMYHFKSWTILNQIGAFFLYLGGTERTLSIVFSGIMGMVYFMAFSIFVFALCQDTILAITTPFLMHFLDLETDFGVTYPFQITDSLHTYGVLGQGIAFLIIAFFCAKKYKIGGFLLGVSLSIHPAIGGFLCLTLFISFLWSYKSHLPTFLIALKYFFLGALISGLSLIIYFKISEHLPIISDVLAADYRHISAKYWSQHRGKISTLSIGILIGIISFLFSLILILFFKKDDPEHTKFPLKILVVAGIIGGSGCLITLLPTKFFSPLLVAAMPSRWLNINVISFIPLFIGISACHKRNPRIQTNLVFFIGILVLVLTFHPPTHWGRMVLLIFLLSSLGFLFFWKIPLGTFNPLNRLRMGVQIPRRILIFVMALVVLGMGGESYKAWGFNKNRLLNWQNDPMFKKMHEQKGTILIDPRLSIPAQLYTRNPLLFASAISSLSYIPATGPLIESILKEVFNEDLFNPSEEAKISRGIPANAVKSVWESKTAEEWKEIRKKFGVTTILVLADWHLQLPVLYGPEKKILNSLNTLMHNKQYEYIAFHIP